jgi:hypothetical protein
MSSLYKQSRTMTKPQPFIFKQIACPPCVAWGRTSRHLHNSPPLPVGFGSGFPLATLPNGCKKGSRHLDLYFRCNIRHSIKPIHQGSRCQQTVTNSWKWSIQIKSFLSAVTEKEETHTTLCVYYNCRNGTWRLLWAYNRCKNIWSNSSVQTWKAWKQQVQWMFQWWD